MEDESAVVCDFKLTAKSINWDIHDRSLKITFEPNVSVEAEDVLDCLFGIFGECEDDAVEYCGKQVGPTIAPSDWFITVKTLRYREILLGIRYKEYKGVKYNFCEDTLVEHLRPKPKDSSEAGQAEPKSDNQPSVNIQCHVRVDEVKK